MHMFLKTDRACFYCLLTLEIIGWSNKSLWIRPSLHILTRFHSTRRPILMLWFHLKNVFRLTFRYYLLLFSNIQCPWHVLVPVLFTWGSNETDKIVLLFNFVCLSFFWKVPLDICIRDKQHTKKGKLYRDKQHTKRKIYRAYCQLADR